MAGFVELTETVTQSGGDSVSGTAESVVRAGPPVTGDLPFVPARSGAEASAVPADGPVLAVADERWGAGRCRTPDFGGTSYGRSHDDALKAAGVDEGRERSLDLLGVSCFD